MLLLLLLLLQGKEVLPGIEDPTTATVLFEHLCLLKGLLVFAILLPI